MLKFQLLTLLWTYLCLLVSASSNKHLIDFVVIGGTGDLAKKHIWPSVFNLKPNKSENIRLFCSGRSKQVVGETKLQSILQEIELTFFKDAIEYVQLASEDDYNNFCCKLNQIVQNSEISTYQRIFYVAIPPKDYLKVVKNIIKLCDLTRGTLKIALEKPFGLSYKTAQQLHHQLNNIPKQQVYIVDHYLWKKVIRHWPIFRDVNENWLTPIWSSNFINEVSIILYETEDINDRVQFYDSCGVIVDILQTHLTQLLLHLVAYKENSSNHLSHIKLISPFDIYLAQYQPFPLLNSHTPTFASAVIRSSHPKWNGTKFYLKSGKALDIKSSKIGIRLKQPHLKSLAVDRWCEDEISHVILLVSPKPAILIHKQLPVKNLFLLCGPEWNSGSNLTITHLNLSNYHVCTAENDKDDSYEQLLDAIFAGKAFGNFLSLEVALASWLPWEEVVLNDGIKVHSYRKNSIGPRLCFDEFYGWKLKEEIINVKDEF